MHVEGRGHVGGRGGGRGHVGGRGEAEAGEVSEELEPLGKATLRGVRGLPPLPLPLPDFKLSMKLQNSDEVLRG